MNRFPNKQKAIDLALWQNHNHRFGDSYGVVLSSKGDYMVVEIDHTSFSKKDFEKLPTDYSKMSYKDIQQIRMDEALCLTLRKLQECFLQPMEKLYALFFQLRFHLEDLFVMNSLLEDMMKNLIG